MRSRPKGGPPAKKLPDPVAALRRSLGERDPLLTVHALARMKERRITQMDLFRAIENGKRNAKDDRLEGGRWSYSMIGRSMDGKPIEVVFAFEENFACIVTVVDRSGRGAR